MVPIQHHITFPLSCVRPAAHYFFLFQNLVLSLSLIRYLVSDLPPLIFFLPPKHASRAFRVHVELSSPPESLTLSQDVHAPKGKNQIRSTRGRRRPLLCKRHHIPYDPLVYPWATPSSSLTRSGGQRPQLAIFFIRDQYLSRSHLFPQRHTPHSLTYGTQDTCEKTIERVRSARDGESSRRFGALHLRLFFLVKFEYELNLTSSLVSRLWFTCVINAISHICICIVSAHLWLHHPRTFNAVCRSGRPFFFTSLSSQDKYEKQG